MATTAASKVFTTTLDFLTSSAASLTHRRPIITCTAASYSPRLAPQPPDLIRWVRSKGGFVHPKLKIVEHSSQGLGLIADGEIGSGSELIALPEHLPLRLQWSDCSEDVNGRRGSPLHQLVHRVPEELWAMRLGLKLLQERAKIDSFWWPYISNLPEAFSVPIFFSGDEIKSLQYAPLLHQVNKRCRFLLDFEKEVKLVVQDVTLETHPFSGQDVDASSLGWAMSAVTSRAFRLHGAKLQNSMGVDMPMLLPLIDMCNHSFHPNAHIVQEQESIDQRMLVHVVAETKIEKNDPITLNYGCWSNDMFLLDYGFLVSSNPYDYVELKYDSALLEAASMAAGVSCPSFSSPAAWQEDILSRLNLHGVGALPKVTLGGSKLVDGRLLAALRVFHSHDMETASNRDLDTLTSLSVEAPLGSPAETAALRSIVALCAITLQYFPTKIMQDETILKGDISSSMKMAVEFRMQKKSMIIDVMRELSKRIRLLDSQKSTVQS